MRTHLGLATATLTSGVLALAMPLTANADPARPVIDPGPGSARVAHAPSVTVHKAGTSTTIGQTGAGLCQPDNISAVQSATVGPPSYTTPAGVITSFSYQGNATAGQVQAVVYGPETSPGNRTVVAKSAKILSAASVLNTFPVRVPVTAGLTLGLWIQNTGMSCAFFAVAGDISQAAIVDPDVSHAFAGGDFPATRVNVSAVVESDADNDGFGDVTQDGCPQSKLTQAACPEHEGDQGTKKNVDQAHGQVQVLLDDRRLDVQVQDRQVGREAVQVAVQEEVQVRQAQGPYHRGQPGRHRRPNSGDREVQGHAAEAVALTRR